MAAPLSVLLVTDSFPPGSGGSGWSTFELARQLQHRGHRVSVVHVVPGDTTHIESAHYDTIAVTRYRIRVPNVPALRNVLKNERLWSHLTRYLVTRCSTEPVDLLHAQHTMTTVPTVRAGKQLGIPSVATVRDYWPVCYWSDLIIDATQSSLCPSCTVAHMRTCTRGRTGSLGPLSWALIPYMRRNLATKRRTLAQADAVIGVSSVITADLIARAPELDPARVSTIPNPVNMDDLVVTERPSQEPFILYAGKLAINKGVQFLLPALDAAGITSPLVVVGDGPLRETLAADAVRRGRTVQWLGWRDRTEVLDLMRRAQLLAFPSYGPESLSRVLIEASALGVPIAAMNTGGTRDILQHEVTGLVSDTPEGFARDLARLAGDAALRGALGAAAARHARDRFEASQVAARVEAVYHQVLST
ncbi:MAG: glycosyltransferase family 4 protein [Acidobacteria bacterium]|nr:glycosyltransferase family 4 protein [Acidobacteriota bacterium]